MRFALALSLVLVVSRLLGFSYTSRFCKQLDLIKLVGAHLIVLCARVPSFERHSPSELRPLSVYG
jgi:hypothetical protein